MTTDQITEARALVERLRLGGDYAHDTEPMHEAAETLTAALDEIERLRMTLEMCPPDRPQYTGEQFREEVSSWWRVWARPALALKKGDDQ